MVYNENSEHNNSILSFPDHDSSQSQDYEELVDDEDQLKLDAEMLVNDSIQNAQEKYQEVQVKFYHYIHYSINFVDVKNEC